MKLLRHLVRYLPLAIGSLGLVLFSAWGAATGRLWRLELVPITGIIISVILISSGILYAVPPAARRRLVVALLIAYAAGVLVMGLRAKGGDPDARPDHVHVLSTRAGSAYDLVMNVVGFVPLGFLFVLGLDETGRLRAGLGGFLAAGAACAAISLGIELGQAVIAGRDSSLVDVATNAAGGIVGAGYAVVYVRVWGGGRRKTTGAPEDARKS